jgi:hypothetical protein
MTIDPRFKGGVRELPLHSTKLKPGSTAVSGSESNDVSAL